VGNLNLKEACAWIESNKDEAFPHKFWLDYLTKKYSHKWDWFCPKICYLCHYNTRDYTWCGICTPTKEKMPYLKTCISWGKR
jgi:hypothetical protein